MTTQTATAATSPSTAVPRTKNVAVEAHTAESLAELTGLPLWNVRGVTPPHATRIGSEYLVLAEHADRLRAIRAGTPVERVYRRENDMDQRAAFDAEAPNRKAIADADAKTAAERKQRDDEGIARHQARMAREKANAERQAPSNVRLT